MGRVSGQPLKVSCMPERHFPEGGTAFISPHFVVYLGQFYFCCIDTMSGTCPFGVLSLHTFGRRRNRSLDLCLTAVLKCSGDRHSSHSPGRGDTHQVVFVLNPANPSEQKARQQRGV